MIKKTFNITAAADGTVTLSEKPYFNKLECGVTKLKFTLPDMEGYAYLLARHDRKEYYAIPILDSSGENVIMMGTTVTQFHGRWAFNICITTTEISAGDRKDSAVYMSDTFEGLVYDNIADESNPATGEPNTIKLANDLSFILAQAQAEQQAINQKYSSIQTLATQVANNANAVAGNALSASNSKTAAAASEAAAKSYSESAEGFADDAEGFAQDANTHAEVASAASISASAAATQANADLAAVEALKDQAVAEATAAARAAAGPAAEEAVAGVAAEVKAELEEYVSDSKTELQTYVDSASAQATAASGSATSAATSAAAAANSATSAEGDAKKCSLAEASVKYAYDQAWAACNQAISAKSYAWDYAEAAEASATSAATSASEAATAAATVFSTEIRNVTDGNIYDSTVAYSVGNRVLYENTLYRCIVANTGILPTNSSYWQKTTLTTIDTRVNTLESVVTREVIWGASSSAPFTLPNNAHTSIMSVDLAANHIYLVLGRLVFPSNSTGNRMVSLTTQQNKNDATYSVRVSPSSTSDTYLQVFMPMSTYQGAAKYYLNAYQNSGSSMNITAAQIFVIRII